MVKQSTTWTPAEWPTQPTMQVQTPKRTVDDVTVQIVQNAAGAVGVAGLGALAGWWLTAGDWQATAIAAGVAGAVVFCAALAVRSFIDEGRLVARAVAKEFEARSLLGEVEAEWAAKLDECEAALSDALAEIDQLNAYVKGLKSDRDMVAAELQQLRATIDLNYRSKASLYEKTRRDAKQLMALTLDAGAWLARDTVLEKLDWQRGRWEEAFALLRDTGCVQQHGAKGNHVRILIRDLDAAYAAIDRYTGAVSLSEE